MTAEPIEEVPGQMGLLGGVEFTGEIHPYAGVFPIDLLEDGAA